MKRLFTFLSFLLFFTVAQAQLLVEDFNFSGGILNNNGWTATAATAATPALSTTNGLTYSGFIGSGIGNAANLGISGEDLTKTLTTPQSSGSLYMTFMVNVSSATTTTGGYITGFTSGATYLTNYNLRVYVKAVTGGIDFGVGRSNGTPFAFTGNTYNLNQTYLITCKYAWVGAVALDDICSIYVHPATPTLSEPATMSATYTGATGSDATSITAIFIRQGATADAVAAVIDGFHVSNVWSETIPVELTKFTAQKANAAVKLAWSTASELNNSHYDIERSTNGKEFTKIGEISGYGSTQEARTYTFMDEKPSAVNYYRLRQVDFDGTATLSKAVSVNFDKNSSIKVYPNVAKDKINIEMNMNDGSADLMVLNLLGQVLKSQKVQNTEGSISLNINDLPNGSYIIRLVSKSGEMTQRFEKQ